MRRILTHFATLALVFAPPFALWGIILWRRFSSVGFAPLVAGYVLAGLGLMAFTFATTYVELSHAVDAGKLSETDLWSNVLNSTLYSVASVLPFVLPVLGLVLVPIAAWSLRNHRVSHSRIAVTLLAIWIALTLTGWTLSNNLWHQTHPLEALGMWMYMVGFEAAAVGLPFLYGIYLVTRWRESATQTD